MKSEENKELSTEMTEITEAIAEKKYDTAMNLTEQMIPSALSTSNPESLAFVMEIIHSICDKTDYTIKQTSELMNQLLNHNEYWIRQDSLKIMLKLFIVKPTGFDIFIEKIETKLFDNDKKVREEAVNLISNILMRQPNLYPGLFLTYSQLFKDPSWTVRAKALEGVINFIDLENPPETEIILMFVENIQSLVWDSDEEVRGLAAEVLKILLVLLSADQIIPIVSKILSDEDWEVREKAIWIIGEIGHQFFDNFQKIFQNLVIMFSDDIMMIQTKVIDAFVKIGSKNLGPELFDFFLPYVAELDDDITQGISESIIYIALQHKKIMFTKLIDQLISPKSTIREMIGNCLLKIYMESPDGIEEELFRMFQKLDPNDWRNRQKTIKLLGHLSYILKIKSIGVWTAINLQEWQQTEKDLDVLDEIDASLQKIHNVFESLDDDIREVEARRKLFYEGMNALEEMPQELRKKTEQKIKDKKFNEAEIILEEEGNQISEKINQFEKKLNESEFKRFSVDVIQDFYDIKDEILENVSDVKSVMFNLIYDGRSEYLEELETKISKIQDRINVLKADFQSIKDLQSQFTNESLTTNPDLAEDFLTNVSNVREKVYNLEFDIGQIWLSNLEFKDFLKQITLYWIDIKIEIQQFLANIFQKFRVIQEEIGDEENMTHLHKKITFEFLNRQFQNTILQAIQSQRDVLESFDSIVQPIYVELRKKKFQDARHLVNLTENNLYSAIENYNREINNIYEDIDKINMSFDVANEIRRYLKDWNEVKDSLLKRIHDYKENIEQEIFIEEIKEFLKYMNPVPLKQLGSFLNISVPELREKLFRLIRIREIDAEIRNDELVQPLLPLGEHVLAFYRKVEIIGKKISFSLRIYNPSKFFIKDINLIFLFPDYLDAIVEESDPTEISIREFEPEAIRVLKWNFRIHKINENRYDLQKFLLNVSYQNPFRKITTFQKEMEMIL